MARQSHNNSRANERVSVLVDKRLLARLAMHAIATGDKVGDVVDDAIAFHLDAVETVPGPVAAALIREVLP